MLCREALEVPVSLSLSQGEAESSLLNGLVFCSLFSASQPEVGDRVVGGPELTDGKDGGLGNFGRVIEDDGSGNPFKVRWELTGQVGGWYDKSTAERCQLLVVEAAEGKVIPLFLRLRSGLPFALSLCIPFHGASTSLS